MKPFLFVILVCGCEPVSPVGSQLGSPDGSIDQCDGTSDAFVFSGAREVESHDFAFFTTAGGKINGMGGHATNTDVLSFGVNVFGLDLETLGDHDVAVDTIDSLRSPYEPTNLHTCDPGNTVCQGFFAHAGTYTVHAVHPRYQATFTLSDLYDRTDNTSPPGAPIAGTITGCVDKANP